MASNPVPRAALSREDGAVVRPALRRTPEEAPAPALTPVHPQAPTDALFGQSSADAPGRTVKPKGKKHKGGPKAGKHESVETVEVVVTVSKPVRRTLKAAAAERETTPEALAALVLTAWLER